MNHHHKGNMKTIILLLLILSSTAFAQINKDQIWDHPNNNYIINLYNTKPKIFLGIDQKDNLLHPLTDERLDLFMADLLDQIDDLDSNSKEKINKLINNHLRINPLENYVPFLNDLTSLALQDEELLKQLQSKALTSYDKTGFAQIHKLRLHKKGRLKRAVENQKISNYNKLIGSPDSVHIQKYLQSSLDVFITNRFTKAKLNFIKKRDIRKIIREFNKITFNKLLQTEQLDRIKYNTEKSFIAFANETNKKMIITVLNPKDVNAVKTKSLFQLLQHHIDKNTFLMAFRNSLPNPDDMPIKQIKNAKYLLATPSLIYANIDLFQSVFKNIQVRQYLSAEDDHYLLKIRKWIKRNKSDFSKKTGITFTTNLPSPIIVLDNIDIILNAYPTNPWDKDNLIYNNRGKEIILGQKGSLKALKAIFETIKPLLRLESLAANTLSIGGFLLSGGNPYVLTLSRSLIYHSIYAKRYGKNYLNHMKENLPMSLLSSATLASGFFPGKLAHAIITGGISGSVQSLVTGQDIKTGFVVGAIQEGILNYLPTDLNYYVVKGTGKNFENAVIEIAQNSIKTGVRGFFIGAIDGGDAIKGMKKGILFGAAEAGARIIIMGYRFDPTEDISQEDINRFLENEHNPVLSDRVYGGENIYISVNELGEIVWRQDAPFRNTLLYNTFFSGSYELGGNSSLSEYGKNTKDTIIHESLHYAQEKRFGFLQLVVNYLKSLTKYGTSIYEDYVFI